jgi:hypothetical protein
MDNNEISFNDFCKISEVNPAEVIQAFESVIDVIDMENAWAIFPMGGIVRGVCISVLEIMSTNGPFDEEKASFIDGITNKYLEYKTNDMFDNLQIIDMPNLSQKDKVYVQLAIQLTETFQRNKEKVCEEANGPQDHSSVIVYMLASFDENEGIKADFQIIEFDVGENEELHTVLYKALIDGWAKFGEPAAIGIYNDVYAISEKDKDSMLPSSKNYAEDYHLNPTTKVFNALSGMLMAPGQKIVVTNICYSYDDFGKPQFSDKELDLQGVEEVSLDLTEKGAICRTVNSFFENTKIEVESIWKKS